MHIPKIVHDSWRNTLTPLFEDFKMQLVLDTVSKTKFYPAKEDVFKVFAIPMDKIRVVILGQDPYPNGEATGLAFGARSDAYMPASLKIIRNEILSSKVDIDKNYFYTAKWQTLEHWWKQGVFLMNTALTVEAKKSNTHTEIWQWFTRVIIDAVSKSVNPIWLLWGVKAQNYKSYIFKASIITKDSTLVHIHEGTKDNFILEAPHPAAEAYNPDSLNKFTGCNHFNLCNDILRAKKDSHIIW